MAISCNSQGPSVADKAYPWRRGADNVPSKTLSMEAPEFIPSKTLSMEAPEFIPRWKDQQLTSCGPTALDGNCYMISLGAYSDDSDDEDDVLSRVPATMPGEIAANSANPPSGLSFRFRRPWRATAAEFVPRETEPKTASSSKDTAASTKQKCTDEEKPWSKHCSGVDSIPVSSGGAKPWAKRDGGSRTTMTKEGVTTTSCKQAFAPWKKKAGTVAACLENGSCFVDESPLSVSTLSTSASSQGFDSTSAASSCTNRSRSSSPPSVREQEAAPLHTNAIEPEMHNGPTELLLHSENASAHSQIFDSQALLRWRHASPSERPSAIFTSAKNVEMESTAERAAEVNSSDIPEPVVSATFVRTSREAKIEPASTAEKSWRNVEKVSKLKVSEDSWTAKQRARRASTMDSESSMSDEEVVRAMKSILNKLTIEKFDSLSKQLINCGIRTSVHLELLIQEVFEKATTQHHFIDMYADLCGLLHTHFSQHPLVDDPKMNFKKILLNCCQTSFEKHLVPPVGLEKLSSEDRTIQEQLYKTRMLGNIRFVGSLLVRKMLASKVMLAIMEELLQDPTPEALESLAALLTVVGPSFDHPDWAYRTTLNAIFAQAERLCKKSTVPQRVRCLLKDVMDIRNAGWQDRRPKKLEGPKKLDDVASDAGMSNKSADANNEWAVVGGFRLSKLAAILPNKVDSPTCSPESAGKQQTSFQHQQKSEKSVKGTSSGNAMMEFLKNREQQAPEKKWRKESSQFDADACKAEVSATLSELRVSHDVGDAVARIAAIAVPLSQQPVEFGDIICRLVDERAQESRKVGFNLLASLFLEGHWNPDALRKGLCTFMEESCPELQCDVPLLPQILRDELHPAFKPLVQGRFLGADEHDVLINF
mmetsp:Transcript_73271/g.115965  ORF Transcript_73271/g.115965 Transcript_73271/m.115965 type:complete len:878 (+) Transcript_73271:77-2710(+)